MNWWKRIVTAGKREFLVGKGYPVQLVDWAIEVSKKIDGKPTFSDWLCRQAIAEDIKPGEDNEKLIETLKKFEKFKPKLPENKRNILNYKKFGDLAETLDTISGPVSKRQETIEKSQEGSTSVYENGPVQVYKITTPEAAMQISQGTQWCTKIYDHARNYINEGPLYVFLLNGKKQFQMHHGRSNQLKDVYDRPASLTSVMPLYEDIMQILTEQEGMPSDGFDKQEGSFHEYRSGDFAVLGYIHDNKQLVNDLAKTNPDSIVKKIVGQSSQTKLEKELPDGVSLYNLLNPENRLPKFQQAAYSVYSDPVYAEENFKDYYNIPPELKDENLKLLYRKEWRKSVKNYFGEYANLPEDFKDDRIKAYAYHNYKDWIKEEPYYFSELPVEFRTQEIIDAVKPYWLNLFNDGPFWIKRGFYISDTLDSVPMPGEIQKALAPEIIEKYRRILDGREMGYRDALLTDANKPQGYIPEFVLNNPGLKPLWKNVWMDKINRTKKIWEEVTSGKVDSQISKAFYGQTSGNDWELSLAPPSLSTIPYPFNKQNDIVQALKDAWITSLSHKDIFQMVSGGIAKIFTNNPEDAAMLEDKRFYQQIVPAVAKMIYKRGFHYKNDFIPNNKNMEKYIPIFQQLTKEPLVEKSVLLDVIKKARKGDTQWIPKPYLSNPIVQKALILYTGNKMQKKPWGNSNTNPQIPGVKDYREVDKTNFIQRKMDKTVIPFWLEQIKNESPWVTYKAVSYNHHGVSGISDQIMKLPQIHNAMLQKCEEEGVFKTLEENPFKIHDLVDPYKKLQQVKEYFTTQKVLEYMSATAYNLPTKELIRMIDTIASMSGRNAWSGEEGVVDESVQNAFAEVIFSRMRALAESGNKAEFEKFYGYSNHSILRDAFGNRCHEFYGLCKQLEEQLEMRQNRPQ